MHNEFSKLNPEQLQAVTHINGPAICIAGPGSGKTTVIVSRLRYMLKYYNISPSSILVVTFTKEAAQNMHSRFTSHKTGQNTPITFSTFHSIFYNMLKTDSSFESHTILSDEKALVILKTILQGRNNILASNNDILRQIFHEISKFKSSLIPISEFNPSILSREQFYNIYSEYSAHLSEYRLIDFEDILLKTYELFLSKPAFLMYWQNRFKYILIDEFQDINPIQFNIIKMLAYPHNNLFAVGDDDQSIYAFRGAKPGMMIDFPKHFEGCKTIYISANYRSQANIVNAASNLVKHNVNRFPKKLYATKDPSENIKIRQFNSPSEEHEYIAGAIKSLVEKGTNENDIAILYRTNSDIGKILHTFIRNQIPFRTKTFIPCIFDNIHLTPVIAMLRFAAGDNTRENFLKFCNKPVRYITRASLSDTRIDILSIQKKYSMEGKEYAATNLLILSSQLKAIADMTPSYAVRYIRDVVGYGKYLEKEGCQSNVEYEEALSAIDDFLCICSDFKSISELLDYIQEYREAINKKATDNMQSAVNILTYHGCKGLEYKYVFLPNVREGVTPFRLSTTPEEIEEERRMFYVAVTRAVTGLTITYSLKSGRKEIKPSRFISELNIN